VFVNRDQQPDSIWDLKMFPWDRTTPRFYPPGAHPAMAQMVEQRKRLQAFIDLQFIDLHGETPDLREARDYMDAEIAGFEQGESDAKALADEQIQRGLDE
jgi:hypothetical protein